MSQALADSLRAETCIVVSDCYRLAPWATALCAQDHKWWQVHPDALKFAGRKFSTNKIEGVETVRAECVERQSSSGVLALEVARRMGAKVIELYGFDNQGSHYFGPHPEPLTNTTSGRFEIFQQQFALLGGEMKKAGIRIVNKTPNSALRCFEFA